MNFWRNLYIHLSVPAESGKGSTGSHEQLVHLHVEFLTFGIFFLLHDLLHFPDHALNAFAKDFSTSFLGVFQFLVLFLSAETCGQ